MDGSTDQPAIQILGSDGASRVVINLTEKGYADILLRGDREFRDHYISLSTSPDGQRLIALDSPQDPGMEAYSAPSILLSAGGGSDPDSMLFFIDKNHNVPVRLGASDPSKESDDPIFFHLRGGSGQAVSLILNEHGMPELIMRDANGLERYSIYLNDEGRPFVSPLGREKGISTLN